MAREPRGEFPEDGMHPGRGRFDVLEQLPPPLWRQRAFEVFNARWCQVILAQFRNAWIKSPLSRPAAAMFRGVVRAAGSSSSLVRSRPVSA